MIQHSFDVVVASVYFLIFHIFMWNEQLSPNGRLEVKNFLLNRDVIHNLVVCFSVNENCLRQRKPKHNVKTEWKNMQFWIIVFFSLLFVSWRKCKRKKTCKRTETGTKIEKSGKDNLAASVSLEWKKKLYIEYINCCNKRSNRKSVSSGQFQLALVYFKRSQQTFCHNLEKTRI